MGSGQRSGSSCVVNSDRQFYEPFAGYGPGNIMRDLLGPRELTETVLSCNLPRRRRADQYLVGVLPNGFARGIR